MQTNLLFFATILLVKLSNTSFVDPGYTVSQWDGWGVRLGFWSNVIGALDDTEIDKITELLFSPEKLNLNIVRYTIGATTPGDTSCGPFQSGANAESFQDGLDKPFLETRNPTARKVLLSAKKHGVDTFEAFSFSPPSWMTRSNCSKGNPDGAPLHDNFDPKYANAFANYITEVVKYYHERHNISFMYLCPFYEPSSGKWTGPNIANEGCNMELSTIAEVIKSTYASIHAKNLTFCSLSVASEQYFISELTTQQYLVEHGLDNLYKKVGLTGNPHGDYKLAELSTLASRSGNKLEQNNNHEGYGNLPEMQAGLQLATQLIIDIQRLAVTSWGIGEAMPYLLELPYVGFENIRYTSGYYCLMQFSKYIRRGYKIVHISNCDEQCIAAYSSVENVLVIVLLNKDLDTQRKSIDLSAFSSLGQISMFRTSAFEPHTPVFPPVVSQNQLNTELKMESVTTIRISNAVAFERNNMIKNGNFESTSQIPVAWFLLNGDRSDHGINGNYVYRGNLSGNLDFTASSLTLMQNTTATSPRIHHLSAWCSAAGPGVWLGILINGQFRTEVEITPDHGYMLYGQSVDGREGDVISIYLRSERGGHSAQIDDVAFH